MYYLILKTYLISSIEDAELTMAFAAQPLYPEEVIPLGHSPMKEEKLGFPFTIGMKMNL